MNELVEKMLGEKSMSGMRVPRIFWADIPMLTEGQGADSMQIIDCWIEKPLFTLVPTSLPATYSEDALIDIYDVSDMD